MQAMRMSNLLHPAPVPENRRKIYALLAGHLFDPYTQSLLANRVIWVDRDSGLVLGVRTFRVGSEAIELDAENTVDDEPILWVPGGDSARPGVKIIDLRHLTVLPGFVDVHVHMFLHPYSETSWFDQLTKESVAERTLRAGVHARKTLMAGFTTVRDLGTEGAGDADMALRKCLAGPKPIIVGPRYYCANRAIVSTGSYGPKSFIHFNTDGVEGVIGAEVADGREECVKAVRRQIGAGADWIKIYADYRVRSRMADVSHETATQPLPLFNQDEFEAMISTAHQCGVKVAAHASTAPVVKRLLDLGVDSIEHGADMYTPSMEGGDSVLVQFGKSYSTTWVPTLAVYYSMKQMGVSGAEETWERAQKTFVKAVELGMTNIACGGDTGTFAHGENALEMVLMRKLGAEWGWVLRWATLGGWYCVRGTQWEEEAGMERVKKMERGDIHESTQERDVPFGMVRRGWAADMVGIEGRVDGTPEEFEKAVVSGVRFVIKGGRVYKQDGQEVIGY